MRKAFSTLMCLLCVGCGGSPPPADLVADCGAALLPRVLACIPDDYRGADADPLAPCLLAAPGLLTAARQCRKEGPAEFTGYLDHHVGHAARVLLESLIGDL